MTKPIISKSQYLKGVQCPKALWLYRNRKDLTSETSPETQAAYDRGNEIGEIAKQRFPNAVEITNPFYEITQAAEATERYVTDGEQVIFEATAIDPASGSYSRIDIFQKMPDTDEWDLIEVKSSTKVKDYHYDDMAFQYHVFTKAGYKIRKCQMMVIDNSYVRQGDIDPHKLLRLEDITATIINRQDKVENDIAKLLDTLSAERDPVIDIGGQCKSPFECDYISHCWRDVPDYSVFKAFPMEEAEAITKKYNTTDIRELPESIRPSRGIKLVELNSYLFGQENIQEADIKKFLSQLQYPLYFLDYETVMPAVPLFDGTRPYQQIPFQFSLHHQDAERGELYHSEYLHKETSDPRLNFIKHLLQACGDSGSIIVYNAAFEKRINNDLADCFPEYGEELMAINERMVDLLVPFKNRWLYNPQQAGSASIKNVLPAFTDSNYDGMGIDSGDQAMSGYEKFAKGDMKQSKCEQLWQDLQGYCALDTLAMVKLLETLKQRICK